MRIYRHRVSCYTGDGRAECSGSTEYHCCSFRGLLPPSFPALVPPFPAALPSALQSSAPRAPVFSVVAGLPQEVWTNGLQVPLRRACSVLQLTPLCGGTRLRL